MRKVYKSLGVFALPHPTEGLLGGGWGDYQRVAYPRYFGKDKQLKPQYRATLARNQAKQEKVRRERLRQFEIELDTRYPHHGARAWCQGKRFNADRDCRVCIDQKCECTCDTCKQARAARVTPPVIVERNIAGTRVPRPAQRPARRARRGSKTARRQSHRRR